MRSKRNNTKTRKFEEESKHNLIEETITTEATNGSEEKSDSEEIYLPKRQVKKVNFGSKLRFEILGVPIIGKKRKIQCLNPKQN